MQAYFQSAKTTLPASGVAGLSHALLGDDKDKFGQYSQNNDFQQSFSFFVQHSSHFLKGSLQEKAKRLFIFCSRGSASLNKSTLVASLVDVIMVVCESKFLREIHPYLADFSSSPESSQILALFLIESLSTSAPSEGDFKISQSSFEDWLSKTDLAQKICHLAFSCIFYQEATPSSSLILDLQENMKTNSHLLLVPLKTTHPLIRETFSSQLLDQSSLILLNDHIPTDYRGKLYPLFSSFHHGESYSMFCKQLVASQGPTLIVVKDTDGHIFGGFAAEKWEFGPKFKGECFLNICAHTHRQVGMFVFVYLSVWCNHLLTGSANCFLFTLAPSMGVYLPSGYNENYMYLEQNAQTLPNGLVSTVTHYSLGTFS